MRKLFVLLIAVGFGLMVGCNQQNDKLTDKQISQPGQHATAMAREVSLELGYLIYFPKEYVEEQKNWPLMVFLHGVGERGSDLDKVKFHGPPMLVEQGKDFPFIIISPQCPMDKWWPTMIEHVMALINETVSNYSVDESRIYLTGLSMGGYGTWTIASTYPDRFAAIVPVCGGGQPYLAENLKNIPIWAFHGAKDSVVPLQQSQQMVDAVKSVGGDAKLTVYPDADHDSWTETYNNDELYGWLLSHSNQQD